VCVCTQWFSQKISLRADSVLLWCLKCSCPIRFPAEDVFFKLCLNYPDVNNNNYYYNYNNNNKLQLGCHLVAVNNSEQFLECLTQSEHFSAYWVKGVIFFVLSMICEISSVHSSFVEDSHCLECDALLQAQRYIVIS